VASAFGNNSDEMAIVTEPNCDEEVRHPVSASDTENGMIEAMAGDVLYSKDYLYWYYVIFNLLWIFWEMHKLSPLFSTLVSNNNVENSI